MKIFAKNKRTVDVFLRKICFDVVHTAVHTAVNIRIIVQFSTFVLHGTSVFYRFQPVVGTLEVDSVAGFISQRPDDDSGMILGTFVHPVGAVHVCGQPGSVFGKRSSPISHAVGFDICFINHVQSVAVAKLIPVRVSRIMRVTHHVDIVLFHQFDVQFHQFFAHGTSQLGVFVAVGSFHQYRNTVDAETSVFDFRGTEADFATGQFGDLALFIFQFEYQCVKMRMLCAPSLYIR